MKIQSRTLVALVLTAIIPCGVAWGADAAAGEASAKAAGEPQKPEDAVQVQVAFYSWLSSLSNEIHTRKEEATSETGLNEILDALDFANFAHVEVQKGKWGLFSELDFVKLSNDTEFRNPGDGAPFKIHADGVVKQTMIEAGGIRSFEGSRLSLDALAGARYFRLESDVNAGPFESEVSKDWVDPLVGARLRLRLSDKWSASLRADLAGFGTGSELTTNAVATVGYDISERYTIGFGYRYMDIDYENGNIELSSTTQGPVIGMVIRF